MTFFVSLLPYTSSATEAEAPRLMLLLLLEREIIPAAMEGGNVSQKVGLTDIRGCR